jgi:branched-chain amino acid transport system ATP-binding protein
VSSPLLECQGLTAGYDGVYAVRNLDLEVREGEVVALLGPNGAGKTTTLLALSGVIRTVSGTITVCGGAVRAGRSHLTARRGLAFVPDDRSLFFDLTGHQNLRLAVQRSKDVPDAVRHVLEYFPALERVLDRQAGLMSGGEQQMLALGRALATRPKVLMVDEMSLGLAPVIVQGLMPAIRRMSTELGTAILLVEQHVDLALKIADRGYVLDRGAVSLKGDAVDLRGRRDLLRASYMGELAYEGLTSNGNGHHTGNSVTSGDD